MRRSILIPISALFLFLAPGCEQSNCEECKLVTYEDGKKKKEEDKGEFCGEELQDKKEYEFEAGNRREEYECS
jgi:hypothetical protein